jgi:hypothetical protein
MASELSNLRSCSEPRDSKSSSQSLPINKIVNHSSQAIQTFNHYHLKPPTLYSNLRAKTTNPNLLWLHLSSHSNISRANLTSLLPPFSSLRAALPQSITPCCLIRSPRPPLFVRVEIEAYVNDVIQVSVAAQKKRKLQIDLLRRIAPTLNSGFGGVEWFCAF